MSKQKVELELPELKMSFVDARSWVSLAKCVVPKYST